MKISYNWLTEYIDTNKTPQEISELLTFSGLEVEGIEKIQAVQGGLEGMVIGEVLTKEKHPDADRLSVTTVDIGNELPLHIVCGASNVAAGQKVVVATVGAMLYPTKGEPFQIKKSKIRGAISEGMICAEDEIGLGDSHDGIMVLDAAAKVGTSASEYFKLQDDWILEIGLTPNRADATSHIGVARDLAAVLSVQDESSIKFKFPDVKDFAIDEKSSGLNVIVEDKEACPRYSGIVINDVNVAPSPDWLQQRLRSIGLKPINNIVDVTNFVLHETGQPLHAFDAQTIKGNKIIVKKAKQGEKFVTLDEVERTLSSENLMVCNAEEPMVIAGVFGGINSGVTASTKNIFLESAYFNAVSVRKTAKQHGLKTDASFRYERGADPNITLYALKRAAILIKQVAGGKIASEITDVYPYKIENFQIEFSFKNCDSLIGKQLEREKIKTIILALGIEILSETAEGLKLSVPPYKVDVTREVDVIEEVLRVYGYNNIELPGRVMTSLSYFSKPDKEKVQRELSLLLAGKGFLEIMNNSLIKAEYIQQVSSIDQQEQVIIQNPLSNDLNALRQTLLFGGLESIAFNINRKSSDLKFFEFGKTYLFNVQKNKYEEGSRLSLYITGNKQSENWGVKEANTDFYSLKGYIESIFQKLGIESDHTIESENQAFAYGLSWKAKNGESIVDAGKIAKKLLSNFDIDQEVFFADINFQQVLKLLKNKKVQFQDIPKFPSVRRDLALLLDKKIKFSEIEKLSFKTEKNLLKRVNLFDVYEGEKIESGKKSYAVSFILQDIEKTLADNQIDKLMEKFIKTFEDQLGAKLR
jgi:phenylalanyl-tRNA synthetase beta chain